MATTTSAGELAIARRRGSSEETSLSDRWSLRLAATLLVAGVVLSFGAGLFHPEREPANNHAAAFAEYASSSNWTAVHLGQFVGLAVLIMGLLVLFVVLNVHSGLMAWINRFGAISAVVAFALYAVLQAVDGVALKQAVDAWVRAPEADKAARFASAESIRWLEWAVRSYESYILGLSLVLFGMVVGWTGRVPKPIGYLMGLSGLTYLAQGWVLGSEGFSATNTAPTLLGIGFILAWSLWLLVIAWRMKASVAPPLRGEIS
jgi:hypothetical protein